MQKFVERNKNDRREESEPIIVVSADDYAKMYYPKKVPLKRMLRRRIEGAEYVALSNNEFQELVDSSNSDVSDRVPKQYLNSLYFVVPEVKMVRGYYHTEMKKVPLGHIQNIQSRSSGINEYTIRFDNARTVHLKTTHRFIRWLGL